MSVNRAKVEGDLRNMFAMFGVVAPAVGAAVLWGGGGALLVSGLVCVWIVTFHDIEKAIRGKDS